MSRENTNMASAKRSRWLKIVIVASVGCVVLLVGALLYNRWKFKLPKGEGRPLPPVSEVSLFPFQYAAHVSLEAAGGFDITRWYMREAVHPDLVRVRGSLRLPPLEDWYDDDFPFRDVVIETNLEGALSEPSFSAESGVYRRISEPGENPAFASTMDGEVWSYVLRHDSSLTKREARLTFELQGIDPESGAARCERHHLRLVKNPTAEGGWFEPAFLITSHTIETFVPDESD